MNAALSRLLQLRAWLAPLGAHRGALTALLLIWVLAALRLFIDPSPRLPLLFNVTPSLPHHLVWLRQGGTKLRRGDLVVYRFEGEAAADRPGLRGQPFFKVLRGLPGDVVTVTSQSVALNGEPMGVAKTHSVDGRALHPIAAGVIPPGHFYVQGTGPDSFDSRYKESGLVRADQVLGTAVVLF
ncbi:hypothetical protein CATMQ487_30560 [Sphaerotilus microaerophilus]|uniref:Peptidase S26 domain-containing protein n=1 Tax=Sphaerotilus microaerophilus TaxID=2914710 RepID=A0ABM7YNQ6_9BURK|nr:hypothetical protein CATMQ487_30560 [Sphaerotilus sp. FB-5]